MSSYYQPSKNSIDGLKVEYFKSAKEAKESFTSHFINAFVVPEEFKGFIALKYNGIDFAFSSDLKTIDKNEKVNTILFSKYGKDLNIIYGMFKEPFILFGVRDRKEIYVFDFFINSNYFNEEHFNEVINQTSFNKMKTHFTGEASNFSFNYPPTSSGILIKNSDEIKEHKIYILKKV